MSNSPQPSLQSRWQALREKMRQARAEARERRKQQLALQREKKQLLEEQKLQRLTLQEEKRRLEELDTLTEQGDHKAAAEAKYLRNRHRKQRADQMHRTIYSPGETAYRWLYYIGVQAIRRTRNVQRHARAAYRLYRRRLVYRIELWRAGNIKRKESMVRSVKAPFKEVHRNYRQFAEAVANARAEGGYWRAMRMALTRLGVLTGGSRRPLRSIFNYLMPVLGLALLLTTITYFQNLTFALSVNYAGEELGYIADESIFENAQKTMMSRVIGQAYTTASDTVPRFSLSVVEKHQLTDADTLANGIIKASGSTLEEADGLYVEGKFVGAVKNGNSVLAYLDAVLQKNSTGQRGEVISFVKSISLNRGLYPVSSVVTLSDIQQRLQGEDEVQRVYTVVANDTPSGISQKLDISMARLRQLNPDIDTRLLPGQQLIIEKSVPLLGVRVTRTEEYFEDIPFPTEVTYDNRYYQGYSAVLSAGKPGKNAVVARVTYVDDDEVERNVLSREQVSDPVAQKVVQGTQKPLTQLPAGTDTSASFIWPVDGGYLSCGINGYYGHTGMDIASRGQIGLPIRAAQAGKVTLAVYSGPYGRHIIIDHGNGVQTLYAHCNALYVKAGDYVMQGQLIAALGRTGRVTGPHLHFEIRVNGRYMDPAKYIGTYYNR